MKLFAISILLIILFLICKYPDSESFRSDPLNIPNDPVAINEIGTRKLLRTVGINEHVKLDRYNNIEKQSFKPPIPEIGETKCSIVSCPSWIKNVTCWKCK